MNYCNLPSNRKVYSINQFNIFCIFNAASDFLVLNISRHWMRFVNVYMRGCFKYNFLITRNYMDLISRYQNTGFEAVADAIMTFFDKRTDLQHKGESFGELSQSILANPSKISTDISLVSIDHSDPEAFALSEVIIRGINAALDQYLLQLSLIHIWRCRRYAVCRSRWSPYH